VSARCVLKRLDFGSALVPLLYCIIMTKNRRQRKGRSNGGKNGNRTDNLILQTSKQSGSLTSTVRYDLSMRKQNFNLTQTPPKQIGNQIYWFKETVWFTFNTSTSTFFEQNFSFTLNQLQDSSSIAAIFDQYCIYAVTANISIDTTTSNPQLCIVDLLSGIDYDSTSAIGPSGLQVYNTCNQARLTTDTSHARFVKPCIAPAVYNGSTFTGYGVSRSWLDSQSTNIPHYGLRFVFFQTNNVITIRASLEYVIGCRNKY